MIDVGSGVGVLLAVAAGLIGLTPADGVEVAEGALPMTVPAFFPAVPDLPLMPMPTSRMLTRTRRSSAPLPIAIFAYLLQEPDPFVRAEASPSSSSDGC